MPSKEYQVVRRISAIIAETPSYREGLRLATECIAKRVQTDACSIFVNNETTGKLVLTATYGLEQGAVESIQLAPNEGITGYCFRTGETVNIHDKTVHPAFHYLDSRKANEFKSLLVVPLTVGGRIIGVMDLARHLEESFPDEIVDMAHAIAAPLAVFILNASLTQAVSRQKTREVGTDLSEQLLTGKAITDGVVRGQALLLSGAEMLESIPLEHSDDKAAEKALMDQALESARDETVQICQEAPELLAEASADIFSVHLMLFDDPTLIQRLHRAVDQGLRFRCALKTVLQEFASEMLALNDDYMRERLADIKDVLLRVCQAADRIEGVGDPQHGRRHAPQGRASIIVARELLPSHLMRIHLGSLAGIICQEGGATAHAAILARSLRIPMLVGVGEAMERIVVGDDLLMDCNTGICYLRPSSTLLRKFRLPLALHRRRDEPPVEAPKSNPQTRDGVVLRLGANISLVSELPLLERYGARGIGLYRTEFMFMIRANYPTEDEQYNVFRRVVQASPEASSTIRVLDVGGDKPLQYVDFGHEENPFLGWRGIRFLLSNPHYFEPHLRAILRTTVHGRVNILLPMVADLDELLQAKEILLRARAELARDGIPCNDNYRLGIMLEVPSAVYALENMLPHIDFVSIGTNDLTQYTLAVDRGNSRVMQWYRQLHPVVVGMIKMACDTVARCEGKSLSICGEIASTPAAVPLLAGLGLRYFSMNPRRLPQVRSIIEKVEITACETLAQEALRCSLNRDIQELMDEFARANGLQSPAR